MNLAIRRFNELSLKSRFCDAWVFLNLFSFNEQFYNNIAKHFSQGKME